MVESAKANMNSISSVPQIYVRCAVILREDYLLVGTRFIVMAFITRVPQIAPPIFVLIGYLYN
jgi:hypothetical protein